MSKSLRACFGWAFLAGLFMLGIFCQEAYSQGGNYISTPEERSLARPKSQNWSLSPKSGLTISETRLVDFSQPSRVTGRYGFFPIKLEIRNLTNVPRELVFGMGEAVSNMTYEVTVPPGRVVTEILYFPMYAVNSHRIYNHGDRLYVEERGGGRLGEGEYLEASPNDIIFVGGGVNFLNRDGLASVGRNTATFAPMLFDELPADWRIYSSLDVLAIEHQEFLSLDKARQNVILEWVSYGGNLALNHFDSTKGSVKAGKMGQGNIMAVKVDTKSKEQIREFFTSTISGRQRKLDFAEKELDSSASEYSLRLPWITAVLIILFVCIVGPINLWVFAPVGKRQRLFWTTPIITVTTGLLLFLFILLSDGFGGSGERLVYVDLFPQNHSARITQAQVSKTGILRKSAFTLSPDVLISNKNMNDRASWDSYAQNHGTRRRGNAATGYFSSRTAKFQLLSTVMPFTRGEVALIGEEVSGAPIILSSLDSPLQEFRYMDNNGKSWKAAQVPRGQKTVLVPSTSNDKKNTLLKGSFIAEGGLSEDIPIVTLDSINWKDRIIYRGSVVKK